jgi:hypothetical protein
MEQLPDVVIMLLLVGVDIHTTTELRRDILHSVSLLCSRLPAEPGDGIVSFNPCFRCPYNLLTASRKYLWHKGCGTSRCPSRLPIRHCYCHFSPKAVRVAFAFLE